MAEQQTHDGQSDFEPRKFERAVVLCPGPSLQMFADREGYDVRIGVNRAVGAFRCDYWVALDVHTAGAVTPLASPIIVNKPQAYGKMCRRFPGIKRLRHMGYSGMGLKADTQRNVGWRRFGATVALVLAANLGARQIDCFGVDWHGQEDFDGFISPKNRRSDRRWERERQLWQQVCAALASEGVAVRRMPRAVTAKEADNPPSGEAASKSADTP